MYEDILLFTLTGKYTTPTSQNKSIIPGAKKMYM